MLHRHAHTIAMMNRDGRTKLLLRDYFDLSRSMALMPSLLTRGLGQADLVLSLLHLRDQTRTEYRRIFAAYVELLVGHPIVIGPSCLLRYQVNGHQPRVTRSSDDRRLIYVAPGNPRQPGTDAHLRWCEYRVGRTVGQLRIRGVTRRDVRKAVRRGWVQLEAAA